MKRQVFIEPIEYGILCIHGAKITFEQYPSPITQIMLSVGK